MLLHSRESWRSRKAILKGKKTINIVPICIVSIVNNNSIALNVTYVVL